MVMENMQRSAVLLCVLAVGLVFCGISSASDRYVSLKEHQTDNTTLSSHLHPKLYFDQTEVRFRYLIKELRTSFLSSFLFRGCSTDIISDAIVESVFLSDMRSSPLMQYPKVLWMASRLVRGW